MLDVTDHAGTPVTHGRRTVNRTRLHGVPKT